jgi:hypothetical protein
MPEFECRREIELPATPEQVWAAVATPEGNLGWLFPSDVAPGEGSKTPDGSTTTAWDPPRHYAVRTEQGDWFNHLEFVLEGRSGGSTVLRYVHAGIFVEDWEKQYDAVQQHTDFYLHTLGQYLRHFAGRTATYIGGDPGGLLGPEASMQPGSFQRLKRALGLGESVSECESVTVTPQGLPPMQAVVDYAKPNFLGLRTAHAMYRFFGRDAFGGPVGMSIHHFGDNVDAEQTTKTWQNWLNAALA